MEVSTQWSEQLTSLTTLRTAKHSQSPPTSGWPSCECHMKEREKSKNQESKTTNEWILSPCRRRKNTSLSPEVLQRRKGFQHCPSEPPQEVMRSLARAPSSHPHEAHTELQDQDGTHVVHLPSLSCRKRRCPLRFLPSISICSVTWSFCTAK